jgi:hypothetical protein
MTALLWGTNWWDRWRERQLDIQEGLRPAPDVRWRGGRPRPWVRPASATYAAAFVGSVLVVLADRHPSGWGILLSAALAAFFTAMMVALYNRGLGGRRGPMPLSSPPKSRVRA